MTLMDDIRGEQAAIDARLQQLAGQIISDLSHPDSEPAPLVVTHSAPGVEHLYSLTWRNDTDRARQLEAMTEELESTFAVGYVFTMPGEWTPEGESSSTPAVLVVCRSYSMDQTYVLLPGTPPTPWKLAFTAPDTGMALIPLPEMT